MMSMNLSDIAILNIKGSEYHCIISLICKNEAINLMQNADFTEKAEHKTKFFSSYIKMSQKFLMILKLKKTLPPIRLLFF